MLKQVRSMKYELVYTPSMASVLVRWISDGEEAALGPNEVHLYFNSNATEL